MGVVVAYREVRSFSFSFFESRRRTRAAAAVTVAALAADDDAVPHPPFSWPTAYRVRVNADQQQAVVTAV